LRIKGVDDVTARFIAWNLSCSDGSYVVVALDDGALQEWRLDDCRIVEERKTSDAKELAATTANKTKTEICGKIIESSSICEYCKVRDTGQTLDCGICIDMSYGNFVGRKLSVIC